MAKFGSIPVTVPQGVEVSTKEGEVTVKGPKGSLTRVMPSGVSVELKDGKAYVQSDSPVTQGTMRSHIQNMVQGVSTGWNKTLELVGAGFRAELKGVDLVLYVGYSHPVVFSPLESTSFKIEKNFVTIDGLDKEKVGELTASIRACRPPDPYKGKGIRIKGEIIKKKAGKAAAKTGA